MRLDTLVVALLWSALFWFAIIKAAIYFFYETNYVYWSYFIGIVFWLNVVAGAWKLYFCKLLSYLVQINIL